MRLRAEALSRKYRGKYALNNVSFELSGGDVCLLLGPNGSGKTTLMKLIAGLVSPSAGDIELDNESVGVATKRRIAYMPTENYFYNYMTVRDAGKYYADFFSDFNRTEYEARAERAELPLNGRIRTLSSGMAAKLRLSLALSRDAAVMMFDEPINGVDMITRDWVIGEIAARRDSGRILLISTHLVEQVEGLANRALFLSRGELVRAGSLDEVRGGRALEDVYREVYGGEAGC